MASKQTEHYGLNQWAGTDQFVRAEFNEDNSKVDAALAGKAEQSDFAALGETVAQKGRVKAGTYVGNGTPSQDIGVGFPILALLVESDDGQRGGNGFPLCGGLALPGISVGDAGSCTVEVLGTGFRVYTRSGSISLNKNKIVYRYLAFGA